MDKVFYLQIFSQEGGEMNEVELRINQLLLEMYHRQGYNLFQSPKKSDLLFMPEEIPSSFIAIINERGQICSYVPQNRVYCLPVEGISSF